LEKLLPNPQLNKIVLYKPGKSIDEVQKELGLKNVIKLASNENPFGTSPKVKESIIDFLNNIHRYPDPNCINLRKKLSEKLKVHFNEIIIGNGSDEIIELIFKAYINKGDEILSCFPTFSYYKIAAEQTFGTFREIPLNNYKFNLSGLANSINNKTKIIIICNPNNPTGTYVSKVELTSFLKSIPSNILVVLDEAYFEFFEKGKEVNGIVLIKEFKEKNIIVLRTFSKIYGLASLRIGYGISKIEIIENLNKVRQPFNVNGIAQIAAIAAIEDENFIVETYENNLKCKKILYEFFDKLKIFYLPSQTNFIFFDPEIDNELVFNELLKRGIIIRSLKSFGYKTALRISIGSEKETNLFLENFEKVYYYLR